MTQGPISITKPVSTPNRAPVSEADKPTTTFDVPRVGPGKTKINNGMTNWAGYLQLNDPN